MKIIVSIFVYITSYFGLMDLWEKSMHFQHNEYQNFPVFVAVFITNALFPFILGGICSGILNPQNIVNYWPILASPFLILCIRLLLDDVLNAWIGQNILGLFIGAGSTALISLLGGWIFNKYIKRKAQF